MVPFLKFWTALTALDFRFALRSLHMFLMGRMDERSPFISISSSIFLLEFYMASFHFIFLFYHYFDPPFPSTLFLWPHLVSLAVTHSSFSELFFHFMSPSMMKRTLSSVSEIIFRELLPVDYTEALAPSV